MEVNQKAPERDEIDLGAIFSALADPNRRAIIRELALEEEGTERYCASFDLPLSKSSRTFHFKILREAGLTWDTDYGNRKGVILRRQDLETRFPGLLNLLVQEADLSRN